MQRAPHLRPGEGGTGSSTRIVNATSGSSASQRATAVAAAIAAERGDELVVVHVQPPRELRVARLGPTVVGPCWLDDPHPEPVLLQARRLAWANGISARVGLIAGVPADGIVLAARDLGAGLVVIGARRVWSEPRVLSRSLSRGRRRVQSRGQDGHVAVASGLGGARRRAGRFSLTRFGRCRRQSRTTGWSKPVGQVILLSLTASLNPTLVGATTVMLLLPSPTKLMLGYLIGAFMTSITLGLVIVFSLSNSSATSTTQNAISPAVDIALGGLALVGAWVLWSGRHERFRERRRARKEAKPDKGPPRWQRELNKGSARTTFVIGALLTLPGASYLAGLDQIHKLKYSTTATVLVVIGFNLVMLWLLEVPLVGFVIAPKWTPRAVDRAKAWVSRHRHVVAVRGLSVIGTLLVIKGILGLIS
jgi:nucleotide-binding universal stress UspA family protein